MKNVLYHIKNALLYALRGVINIGKTVLQHPVFHAWVKISTIIIITFGIGPFLYTAYDWPYNLKPRNYFEFLNTGLLLFLIYHLLLKKKDKFKCWFIDDD